MTACVHFQMDNRGNRLMVTDDSEINTPAISAGHVVKRYTGQAPDELTIQVMCSVLHDHGHLQVYYLRTVQVLFSPMASGWVGGWSDGWKKFVWAVSQLP